MVLAFVRRLARFCFEWAGSRKTRYRMADEELEGFKTRIDLRAYAAAQGYQLDRRESWAGSCVMRHPNGDKIIIKRAASDNHYIYFSVRSDRDNGSIVDFVQNRNRVSLGVVRKELRPWIGAPPVSVPSFAPLAKSTKDRLRVETEFAKMQDATRHPYLENERCISAEILACERFTSRIRTQQPYGNAIFPHFDADGLSGFEIKNKGFTGFSPGGAKGLWLSREGDSDRRLVFCESAIDALSYANLGATEQISRTRYASIGGKPSPLQLELIRQAIARMPLDGEIISAMDADAEGAKLVEIVRSGLKLCGRDDLRFTVHEPLGWKDWNDQLRATAQAGKPPLPYRPKEPFVA
jgi:uncharacterized protein DUF3991/Toprim domain-containing protein